MRGKDTQRTEFTNGQLVLHRMVEGLGFAADMEVVFHPFVVDIYIREVHAAIEFDGAHTMKKRDKERDAHLMEYYSLPVLRITRLSPKNAITKEIVDFLGNCAKDAVVRRNRESV